MNTKEVEKVLGKSFEVGKSLQEQCTPEQWDEICFLSEMEIDILVELGRPGIIDPQQTEKKVRGKWQKILKEANGNHRQALNQSMTSSIPFLSQNENETS